MIGKPYGNVKDFVDEWKLAEEAINLTITFQADSISGIAIMYWKNDKLIIEFGQ